MCKKCLNFRNRERWHEKHPNAPYSKIAPPPRPPNNIQEIILQEREEKYFLEHYCDGKKKCVCCFQFKLTSEFHKDTASRDSYLTRCKACVSLFTKDTARHFKKPWLRALSNCKTRAKKLRIPCTLNKEFLEKLFAECNGICPILHVPMQVGGDLQFVPSLDRINPKLGYVPSNVRLISFRANSLRQDATIEELALVLEDAKKLS